MESYPWRLWQDLPDEWDICEDVVRTDPNEGLKLVIELLNASKTEPDEKEKCRWIYYIAAGPLEDLISKHGETIIDDVVAEMGKNDLFLLACTGVWPLGRDTGDRVWTTFICLK